MALLDNVKRLVVEEFKKEDQEMIEKLSTYYNFFVENVTNVVNGNIDFDNMNRSDIQFTVTVGANGVPTRDLNITSNSGAIGINVLRAENLTNTSTFPSTAPFVSYTPSGTGVYKIEHITGLQANNQYRITAELIF